MPYNVKLPDEEMLLAVDPVTGAKLYAYLADCPLYVHVRIVGAGIVGKRVSFWLGWKIGESTWAIGKDQLTLPASVLDWAAPFVRDLYPDYESAGLAPNEVTEIKREQAYRRAAHKARRET